MAIFKYMAPIILLSFFTFSLYGKTAALSTLPNDSNKTKPSKTIVFYSWGMPDFGYPIRYEKCEDSLQHKYGFYYRRKAGCLVSTRQRLNWNRHNNTCERRMRRRFGANWRQQYEKELNDCANGQ